MSKYRNKITEVDGIKFHSKKEAKRWGELKLLERAGEILHLERQVKYAFEHNGVNLGFYVCDFKYVSNGDWIIEDVKGFKTAIYRQKKKMMEAFYGIEIKET